MHCIDDPHSPSTRADIRTEVPAVDLSATQAEGDPSRTGTMWLGVTGVAMLLAAAAVLTAVRWGDIGQTAKLGGLVAITLAMLFGGRRLQPTIPLTGRAIFHLGVLLIPFDMAAVAVLAERTWQETLVLLSVTAVASWSALTRVDPSPVLRGAAVASIPLFAAGLAAVTPLSMPLVLAAAAGAATIGWLQNPASSSAQGSTAAVAPFDADTLRFAATAWTALAGLLPLASFVTPRNWLAEVMHHVGLIATDRWQLVAAGVAATVLSGVAAAQRPSLTRGWLTILLAALTGVVATAAMSGAGAGHLIGAGLFLLGEFALLAVRDDEDWAPLRAVFGPLIEVLGGCALAVTALTASFGSPATPLIVAAAVTHGLGWLTADRRRVLEPNDWLVSLVYGSGWTPATIAVPIAALTNVIAADGGAVTVGVVLLACGLWAVATGRPHGSWLAIVTSTTALLAAPVGWWMVAGAAAAILVLTIAARADSTAGREGTSFVVAGASTLAGLALFESLESVLPTWIALPVGVTAMWLSGSAVGLCSAPSSWFGRGLAITALALVWSLSAPAGLAVCVTVAALAGLEWIRHHSLAFEVTGAVALSLAVIPAARLGGLAWAEAGLVATSFGLVATGLLLVVPLRGERPLALLGGVATLVGIVQVGAESVSLLGPALLVAASSIGLVGTAARNRTVIGTAALVAMCGLWIQLATWQVTWLEAYLAVPGLIALWAGWIWHRDTGQSTWVTHAPIIAIFGGIAVADRLLGGSAWHAVIAGGVAVAAIVAGAVFRLIGPLVTGTALLAVVVTNEVVQTGTELPTWGWLALGGSVLLGTAVAMERKATTPIEQGQRLVQVLSTRYG